MDLVEFLRFVRDRQSDDTMEAIAGHTLGCSVRDVPDGSPSADLTDPEKCSCKSRRLLREAEAKRLILDAAVTEKHHVSEDCWYTCPAATEGREGETNCNDNAGTECNCGRDRRLERTLRALALPFADHPDYDPSWAPASVG